ncbi:hypothetical protein [Burkholderia cenocepacia]|uniref:hypothetical protein n=1 Tax=Burkholderia cenocepacia TaxID=95486 RepID=UPI00196AC51E|nr:hypothetical protein [Burkholderia cenocepacia]MBN3565559.1 hypothetical protein [Burkholderia cenocepacia]MBR8113278.1 hypothetical protein [Burkholderia cenocepacia]
MHNIDAVASGAMPSRRAPERITRVVSFETVRLDRTHRMRSRITLPGTPRRDEPVFQNHIDPLPAISDEHDNLDLTIVKPT